MAKSSKSARRDKPAKPRPDFPLFPHNSGDPERCRWAKKIRGKFHYFGKWIDDPRGEAALQKYLDEKDDLYAGRTPRANREGLTVAVLCDKFLNSKRGVLDTGEIKLRTWQEYYQICGKIVSAFGANRLVEDLAADDFEQLRSRFAKGRGPVSLAKDIRLARILFKYADDAGLIERPVRFGPNFKSPGKRILRQERNKNGKRMFEAAELRQIIHAAPQPLRAMILLGINGGLGQTDIANLPQSAVDRDAGWLDYPRPKTAVHRRIPLWPETVDALREAVENRPKPTDSSHSDLCFITQKGNVYVRNSGGEKESWTDSIALEFGKLLRKLKLKRARLNFYALRHTFETIAGESRDQVAVDHVMGHARDDTASLDRERISDERLRDVVNVVRNWLKPWIIGTVLLKTKKTKESVASMTAEQEENRSTLSKNVYIWGRT